MLQTKLLHSNIISALAIMLFAPAISLASERYTERPNIADIVASEYDLGEVWNRLKVGHIEAVAELLEMYPEHELYFLARDAELLYDLAKLAMTQKGDNPNRLHLINVSRANADDVHIREYLAQHAISLESLAQGKKVLFVDTGFAGSIPAKILQWFKGYEDQLQTHLICSSNDQHPSTRTFLLAINPAALNAHPSNMHGTIINYEHLPRFLDRSYRYEEIMGVWEAMSDAPKIGNHLGIDGSVSRIKAQEYMADLKFYVESEEGQALLKSRRKQWASLRQMLTTATKEELTVTLQKLLKRKSLKLYSKAMVRDFLEIVDLHFPALAHKLPSLAELKLRVEGRKKGNKLDLIERHPAWKDLLEDPTKGISALLAIGDYQTLRNILDVIVDAEFVIKAFIGLNSSYYAPWESPLAKAEMRMTLQTALKKVENIAFFEHVTNSELISDPQIIAAVSAPLFGAEPDPMDESGDDEDNGDDEENKDQQEGTLLEHAIDALCNSNTTDQAIHLALANLLDHVNYHIRFAAVTTLRSLKSTLPAVHAALVDAVTINQPDDQDNDLIDAIRAAIIEADLSQSFAMPKVHGPLFETLRNGEDAGLQIDAIWVLGPHKHIDKRITLALIDRLQNDKDEDVRFNAAAALGGGDENAKSALKASLANDLSPKVRASCASALSESYPIALVRDLLFHHFMNEGDAGVRAEILEILTKPKDADFATSQVPGMLVSALEKDKDPMVRAAAAKMLQLAFMQGDIDYIQRILTRAMLNDPDAKVREAALLSLVKIKPADPRVVKSIALRLGDKEEELRRAARYGLANLCPAIRDLHVFRQIAQVIDGQEPATQEQITSLMSAWGLDARIGAYDKLTPLWNAARLGRLESVKTLVERGDTLDPVNRAGFTPLAEAVVEGHVEVVRYLLSMGANPFHLVGYASLLDLARKCKMPNSKAELVSLIGASMDEEPKDFTINRSPSQGTKRDAPAREERELEKKKKPEDVYDEGNIN